MSETESRKASVRRQLRETLASLTDHQVRDRSLSACALLASTPEFAAANTIMMYLSMTHEVDTAALALRGWQAGKTVVVPKVSWDQKRMLPVEITSLSSGIGDSGMLGIREPIGGQPVPINEIDLVIVPGLGFSPSGQRIGRGMGFYDRFLSQSGFIGLTCGIAFAEQVIDDLPTNELDVPLGMLVTDREIRRFAGNCIRA